MRQSHDFDRSCTTCCIDTFAILNPFLINMFTALKGSQYFFAITAAGVVSCDGPIMSPRTSSIVQIISSFWSFEISEGIPRNQKIIIG